MAGNPRGVVVKVEGAKELARQFRAAGGNVKELSGAYKKVALALVPPAQRAAPRSSTSHAGRLAATTRGKGQRTRAILAAGSARVPYANPVHWGNPTVKTYPSRKANPRRATGTLGVIGPNPWLYETADKRRDEVADAFEEHVNGTFRRYGLRGPIT